MRHFLRALGAPLSLRFVRARRMAALEAVEGDARAALAAVISAACPGAQGAAQLGQDAFALLHTGLKRGGFFVEFGAGDGVHFSNTLVLERHFGWRGILAEPARAFHGALARNRACAVDHRCVWRESGARLPFTEPADPELSTLAAFAGGDAHAAARRGGARYEVETVSLNDLLAFHNAPGDVDYLSVDTEGSELEILSALDFGRYRPRVITCEHNFTPAREAICALLSAQGYRRVWPALSRWDDWYVRGESAAL